MDDTEEFVLRGKSFLESGDFDKALDFFEQALLLNPKNPDLWNYKGIVLRSLGRYAESIDCFNNSLKIDPRDKFAS
jgi:tetratricopeptide (TPR) repeat protein